MGKLVYKEKGIPDLQLTSYEITPDGHGSCCAPMEEGLPYAMMLSEADLVSEDPGGLVEMLPVTVVSMDVTCDADQLLRVNLSFIWKNMLMEGVQMDMNMNDLNFLNSMMNVTGAEAMAMQGLNVNAGKPLPFPMPTTEEELEYYVSRLSAADQDAFKTLKKQILGDLRRDRGTAKENEKREKQKQVEQEQRSREQLLIDDDGGREFF